MKVCKKIWLFALTFVIAFAFTLKSSYAYANSDKYVYLGGYTAGFTLDTEGVTVVGLTDVFTDDGLKSPSKNAGIMVGDIILSMNENKISTANDVYSVLKSYKDGYIVVKIERKGVILLKDVFPEKDMTGSYKLGVFLRDDISGIGTITYIEDDGKFASLGHPVTDESGRVYNVQSGSVFNCSIVGVNKATRGKTGELKGLFIGDKSIGKITANTAVGLFGVLTDKDLTEFQKVMVGSAKVGSAKIYSTVDGEKPKFYDIEIVKCDLRDSITKNLVVKIVDKNLIEYTGGIVQGMSGSPIIQNGKIVGAVTHVFVNDSTRGYGISIQNMLIG